MAGGRSDALICLFFCLHGCLGAVRALCMVLAHGARRKLPIPCSLLDFMLMLDWSFV